MECPHLGSHVKTNVSSMTKKANGDAIPSSWICQVCRSTKSPWMCLQCGIILCGRYVNCHAKQHWEECHHCAGINCLSLGVFCYECNEYVVNDTRAGALKEVRNFLEDVQNAQCNKQQKNNKENKDDEEGGPPKKRQATNSNKHSILGLRNLGNTCFMNAVLQSLSNIHQFAGFFKELPAVELRSGKTAGKRIYNTRNLKHDDVSLVEELRRVLCALWQGGHSAISPDSLFTVMWKIFPRFRGYQQQDAHEFMRYLLDRLHSELQGSRWPNQTRQQTNGKSTIVTLMFGGLLLSEVHCQMCGSFFKKIDPFLDISLEIPEQFRARSKQKDAAVCRLEDCLRRFTEVEELAESEHYLCTQCSKRQPSTKQFSVRCLPNVLCVHLKRFQWSGFLRSKIDTFVKFPAKDLDLRTYLLKPKHDEKNGTTYDLAAVVVHQGSGAGCGHYIAFAKQEGQWFCFNDSTVTPVEEKTVLRCKAYLLFYTCHTYQHNDHFQLAQSLQEEISREHTQSSINHVGEGSGESSSNNHEDNHAQSNHDDSNHDDSSQDDSSQDDNDEDSSHAKTNNADAS